MVNIRNSATMTPAGFPWYDQWGSARYASNNAFLHAVDYSEPFSHINTLVCLKSGLLKIGNFGKFCHFLKHAIS